jgi:peptidoglycan hydrolase-like protein with peptidoglycan-binding domain
MLSVRASLTLMLLAALASFPVFASHTHHAPTSGHSNSTSTHKGKTKKAKVKGQRQIDPERARQIQTALIHENYLSGSPSGNWDSESQEAMKRFQADHGWQTKIMPDSRALIKLGLGPAPVAGAAPAASKLEAEKSKDAPQVDDPNTLAAARATGR